MTVLDYPTIQAQDEPESTVYILRRPGMEPVMAYWPQPLEQMCPEAVRITSYAEPDIQESIVVLVGFDSGVGTPAGAYGRAIGATRKELQAQRRELKERTQRLREWRRARPRRFLRTGRAHNKNARLTEQDIRAIQHRHYTGFESLRSICRELWQEKGFPNDKAMLNSVCQTLSRYGLRKRTQSEMTASSNRKRWRGHPNGRRPGETEAEHKHRRRLETGEVHGRQCTAVKTRPGKGRGERCELAALFDSEFCRHHDARFVEEIGEHLVTARARRNRAA